MRHGTDDPIGATVASNCIPRTKSCDTGRQQQRETKQEPVKQKNKTRGTNDSVK